MLMPACSASYDELEGKNRQKMASWRHQNARAGGALNPKPYLPCRTPRPPARQGGVSRCPLCDRGQPSQQHSAMYHLRQPSFRQACPRPERSPSDYGQSGRRSAPGCGIVGVGYRCDAWSRRRHPQRSVGSRYTHEETHPGDAFRRGHLGIGPPLGPNASRRQRPLHPRIGRQLEHGCHACGGWS